MKTMIYLLFFLITFITDGQNIHSAINYTKCNYYVEGRKYKIIEKTDLVNLTQLVLDSVNTFPIYIEEPAQTALRCNKVISMEVSIIEDKADSCWVLNMDENNFEVIKFMNEKSNRGTFVFCNYILCNKIYNGLERKCSSILYRIN